jgi:hypothetical protein
MLLPVLKYKHTVEEVSRILKNQSVAFDIGPCHVSRIFLPLRVKSLPLATIYEVKIPLRKWKKSLLQRNPAQMTSAIVSRRVYFCFVIVVVVVVVHILIVGIVNTSPRPRLHPALPPTPLPSMPEPSPV